MRRGGEVYLEVFMEVALGGEMMQVDKEVKIKIDREVGEVYEVVGVMI